MTRFVICLGNVKRFPGPQIYVLDEVDRQNEASALLQSLDGDSDGKAELCKVRELIVEFTVQIDDLLQY